MAQPDFTIQTARLLSESGLNVMMETCGYAAWEHYERVLPYIRCFLYDYKVDDPEQHRQWTGEDNRLILENLKKLSQSGAEIVLRCPVIPGINDTHDHFERIAVLSRQLSGIRQVDLLPYHSFGNGKRAQLGQAADGFYAPQEEMVEQWIGELSALCHGTVCRA